MATWYIFLMVMVSCSCCATTDLSSGVRAALNRFILKKLTHMASYCLKKARNLAFEIPPLRSFWGYGILASYSSKLSLMTLVVLVMRESSLLVVSLGFMAKFDNPSRINLSFVWTVYSCLKRSLKSDQTSLTFSSVFQSTMDESHSRAGFRRELAKW